LNQWPPAALIEELAEKALSLPQVGQRESQLAGRNTKAIFLDAGLTGASEEAFIDDHEFCHLHPAPAGSLHLTLPQPVLDRVIQSGWAEFHPLAGIGTLPKGLVLVYAPRDEHELAVVFELIKVSYRFAQGL
jgi:phospholipase/carboxylesterase